MLCSAVWCNLHACFLTQEDKRHLSSNTKVENQRKTDKQETNLHPAAMGHC